MAQHPMKPHHIEPKTATTMLIIATITLITITTLYNNPEPIPTPETTTQDPELYPNIQTTYTPDEQQEHRYQQHRHTFANNDHYPHLATIFAQQHLSHNHHNPTYTNTQINDNGAGHYTIKTTITHTTYGYPHTTRHQINIHYLGGQDLNPNNWKITQNIQIPQ